MAISALPYSHTLLEMFKCAAIYSHLLLLFLCSWKMCDILSFSCWCTSPTSPTAWLLKGSVIFIHTLRCLSFVLHTLRSQCRQTTTFLLTIVKVVIQYLTFRSVLMCPEARHFIQEYCFRIRKKKLCGLFGRPKQNMKGWSASFHSYTTNIFL